MPTITWIIPDLTQALHACDNLPLAKDTTDFLKTTSSILNAIDIPSALYRILTGENILPRAALLALYHDLSPSKTWLLCEPVELIAERHEVLCLGNAHIQLSMIEAQAFATTLNDYWEGTGRMLYTPTPTQWLLGLAQPIDFKTKSLRQSLNQPIKSLGNAWDILFSEAQMLMQGHAVNRARSPHLPRANGIWFSGEGDLPALEKRPKICVMTNNHEAIALTRSVMGKVIAPVENFDAFWKQHGKSKDDFFITLSSDTLNAVCYEHYLEMLENNWIRPYLLRDKAYVV